MPNSIDDAEARKKGTAFYRKNTRASHDSQVDKLRTQATYAAKKPRIYKRYLERLTHEGNFGLKRQRLFSLVCVSDTYICYLLMLELC